MRTSPGRSWATTWHGAAASFGWSTHCLAACVRSSRNLALYRAGSLPSYRDWRRGSMPPQRLGGGRRSAPFRHALGETDTPAGWRPGKAGGGCLIDVTNNEVVLRGLSMPHSPRLHGGELWLLNSGHGQLNRYNRHSRQLDTVAELPGYTRKNWTCSASMRLSACRTSARQTFLAGCRSPSAGRPMRRRRGRAAHRQYRRDLAVQHGCRGDLQRQSAARLPEPGAVGAVPRYRPN